MSVPFQATHTADDGRYYMVDECEWFYAHHMGHWKRHWSGAPAGLKELDKKPWSGPEDGLPPVGMKLAFKGLKSRKQDCLYALNEWCAGDVVSVVAHVMLQGELSALYWNEQKMSSSTVRPDLLEPIKTAEQIAADQRSNQIREIMDVAGIDCLVTATRLVDAGFKREVV